MQQKTCFPVKLLANYWIIGSIQYNNHFSFTRLLVLLDIMFKIQVFQALVNNSLFSSACKEDAGILPSLDFKNKKVSNLSLCKTRGKFISSIGNTVVIMQ